MTSEEDGILIEDIGLPPKIKPEKLPEGLNETLLTMDVGNSFFLQTDNDQHSARKIGALRERIKRFGIKHPERKYSIWKEDDGVRVYRVEDDADYK